MSTYVSRFLIPGYEDYEAYLYRSCILKHWPSMWEGEIAAEAGLWKDRLKKRKQGFFFSPPHSDNSYLMQYHSVKRKPVEPKQSLRIVLAQLAKENNWEKLSQLPNGKVIYRIKPYELNYD